MKIRLSDKLARFFGGGGPVGADAAADGGSGEAVAHVVCAADSSRAAGGAASALIIPANGAAAKAAAAAVAKLSAPPSAPATASGATIGVLNLVSAEAGLASSNICAAAYDEEEEGSYSPAAAGDTATATAGCIAAVGTGDSTAATVGADDGADGDGGGEVGTAEAGGAEAGANGTGAASISGAFVLFTPSAAGTDSFTYTVTDAVTGKTATGLDLHAQAVS